MIVLEGGGKTLIDGEPQPLPALERPVFGIGHADPPQLAVEQLDAPAEKILIIIDQPLPGGKVVVIRVIETFVHPRGTGRHGKVQILRLEKLIPGTGANRCALIQIGKLVIFEEPLRVQEPFRCQEITVPPKRLPIGPKPADNNTFVA